MRNRHKIIYNGCCIDKAAHNVKLEPRPGDSESSKPRVAKAARNRKRHNKIREMFFLLSQEYLWCGTDMRNHSSYTIFSPAVICTSFSAQFNAISLGVTRLVLQDRLCLDYNMCLYTHYVFEPYMEMASSI